MKSVVIAYEDDYCEELHLLIKRLRGDLGLPGLCLEPIAVRGTGGFVNEVPKLLRIPLKQTRLPPDRVICLADADRPRDLVPNAPAAPSGDDPGAVERWVLALQSTWRESLVKKAHLDEPSASRLRVICLRWNKESVLLACPDALLDLGLRHGRRDRTELLLRDCDPSPLTSADGDFTQRYRKPGQCMNLVFQAIAGRRFKKGRDDEDLLRDLISPQGGRRAEVLRRCPDLGRLLQELE